MIDYASVQEGNVIKWMELALVILAIGANFAVKHVQLACMDRAVGGGAVNVRNISLVPLLMADALHVNQAGMGQSVIKLALMVSLGRSAPKYVLLVKMDLSATILLESVFTAILAGRVIIVKLNAAIVHMESAVLLPAVTVIMQSAITRRESAFAVLALMDHTAT